MVDSNSVRVRDYTERLIKLDYPGKYVFTCTRCGKCCSSGPNVALTIFDVVRMARFLRVHWREFITNYVKVVIADIVPYMLLKGDEKGRCIFLSWSHDGKSVCTLYPARPMRCRTYPILVESLKPRRLYIDPESPGVGQGRERIIPQNLIEQYVRERARHYRILYSYIVEEGYEPLQALYKSLDDAWHEAELGAEWANLDYIESLGAV